MGRRSIFFEEWKSSLRAHYLHVVRINDQITEPTLRRVLLDAGVSDNEIERWYQEAVLTRQSSSDSYQDRLL
jgi:hypothetical protein